MDLLFRCWFGGCYLCLCFAFKVCCLIAGLFGPWGLCCFLGCLCFWWFASLCVLVMVVLIWTVYAVYLLVACLLIVLACVGLSFPFDLVAVFVLARYGVLWLVFAFTLVLCGCVLICLIDWFASC